jgi:hypothetical protein
LLLVERKTAHKPKHRNKGGTMAMIPKRRADTEVGVGKGRVMIGDGEGTDQQTGTPRRRGSPGRHPESAGGQARAGAELLLETGLMPEIMTYPETEITANIDSGVEMLLARIGERDSVTETLHAPVHRGKIPLVRFAGNDEPDRPINPVTISF